MNDIPDIVPENIYPVGPRLLLEVFKHATETREGLIMTESEGHATPTVGTVIRTGETSMYQVGDVLMWRRYGIDNIKVYTADGDKEVYLLEENEVIAKLVGQVVPTKNGAYAQITEKQNASRPSEEEQGEDISEQNSTEKKASKKSKE